MAELYVPHHTERVWNPYRLERLTTKVHAWMQCHGIDTVVGLGNSGLLLGGALMAIHKANFVVVRRPDDEPVGDGRRVNGRLKSIKKWAIVDDLISSGSTLLWMLWCMEEALTRSTHTKWIYPSAIGLYHSLPFDGCKQVVLTGKDNFADVPEQMYGTWILKVPLGRHGFDRKTLLDRFSPPVQHSHYRIPVYSI